MNFQQLRIIRETVRRSFNLTDVAGVLFTSQSGVSKHIKDLEYELGIEIFVRKGKRLLGLTEPGRELVVIVERMLRDAANIKRLADQLSQQDEGQLTVATTHTQARYVLPRVVSEFKKIFPKVHLKLHQGSPDEIATLLQEGRADIAIATESLADSGEVVSFEYYRWHHAIMVPEGHPLEHAGELTLDLIAQYPLITYHEGFTGRASIDRIFADAQLQPDIVMSALDADVIKSYVELGLGIGIVASMAFNPLKDTGLRLLDSQHLFEENVTRIALHRGHYLRGFAYRFIELCAPALTQAYVRETIASTDAVIEE
jgi:LysR family transcriptional regulator, cys regulon transcriptional activator